MNRRAARDYGRCRCLAVRQLLMAILRSAFASARLGAVIFKTPLLKFASIMLSSSELGSPSERPKLPKLRSARW